MAAKKNSQSQSHQQTPSSNKSAQSTSTAATTATSYTSTTTSASSTTASLTPSSAAAPAGASTTHASNTTSSSSPQAQIPSSLRSAQDFQQIAQALWQNYLNQTPARTKQLDAFQAFLLVVGVLQFVYCVLGGNYPFNAFLSGFSATVGQFVLTASLRMQTNDRNAQDFKRISHERAFADYVFGSVILHFFCINFIN